MRPAGTGQMLLEQGGTMSQRANLMKVSRPNLMEVGILLQLQNIGDERKVFEETIRLAQESDIKVP